MIKFSFVPVNQNYHFEGVRHMLPADAFFAMERNLVLTVDVREENEVVKSSADCSQLFIFPFSDIGNFADDLAANLPVLLISNHGERSIQTAAVLMKKGFKEVYNLDGGLHSWIDAGLPVAGTGGCSCGCH
jgi:rhodanese-related sulfurtransferase